MRRACEQTRKIPRQTCVILCSSTAGLVHSSSDSERRRKGAFPNETIANLPIVLLNWATSSRRGQSSARCQQRMPTSFGMARERIVGTDVVPEEVLLIEEAIPSQLTRGASASQAVTRSCTACGCGNAWSSGRCGGSVGR